MVDSEYCLDRVVPDGMRFGGDLRSGTINGAL